MTLQTNKEHRDLPGSSNTAKRERAHLAAPNINKTKKKKKKKKKKRGKRKQKQRRKIEKNKPTIII